MKNTKVVGDDEKTFTEVKLAPKDKPVIILGKEKKDKVTPTQMRQARKDMLIDEIKHAYLLRRTLDFNFAIFDLSKQGIGMPELEVYYHLIQAHVDKKIFYSDLAIFRYMQKLPDEQREYMIKHRNEFYGSRKKRIDGYFKKLRKAGLIVTIESAKVRRRTGRERKVPAMFAISMQDINDRPGDPWAYKDILAGLKWLLYPDQRQANPNALHVIDMFYPSPPGLNSMSVEELRKEMDYNLYGLGLGRLESLYNIFYENDIELEAKK